MPEMRTGLVSDDLGMEEHEVARYGRVYKKSNWTSTELNVLQTAKREDQIQQLRADAKAKHKSAAGRWQWIEDYCWERNVERSAQQCRDRWERMSADFKKVGDFERQRTRGDPSYWQMTIEDRKLKKLPSSFHVDVFNALSTWFVRSRVASLPDGAIDGSCPSPMHEHAAGATGPLTAEISIGNEEDIGLADGPSHSTAGGQKRKLPQLFDADRIAVAIDRANHSARQTVLECEDRKDRRHKETLESNERMANAYISALINIGDALRQIATSRVDRN